MFCRSFGLSACSFAKVVLSRHALVDGLEVHVGSCSVDVLALPAALPRWSSPGMLLEMVWMTFYRSWATRLGHVLSMFWLACSFAEVVFSWHTFGDGLDDFFKVLGVQAGRSSVDFWVACSFAKVVLSRHAFEDGLEDFLQVLGDEVGPCSVDVLACMQLCRGGPPQAYFW